MASISPTQTVTSKRRRRRKRKSKQIQQTREKLDWLPIWIACVISLALSVFLSFVLELFQIGFAMAGGRDAGNALIQSPWLLLLTIFAVLFPYFAGGYYLAGSALRDLRRHYLIYGSLQIILGVFYAIYTGDMNFNGTDFLHYAMIVPVALFGGHISENY